MRIIETKVYNFNELSEIAKDKVIENLCDINVDYDWWNCIYEDAATIGLNLSSFDLDRNRHANGEFTLSACEIAQNIFNNHGDKCDTFKTAKGFMESWQPIFDMYMDENDINYESHECESDLQELEDEFLKSLLEDYSIMLQNESEYLQSDEAIIETIEANEYEFTEDGEIA